MNYFDLSYRKTENAIKSWNLDLGGRVPDHATISRAYNVLDTDWLEKMVALTAEACLKQAGADKGDMAADSTGVETDRYEDVVRSDKKSGKDAPERVKSYLKWHISAVVGLQVILSCAITTSSVADTSMLLSLLEKSKKLGRSFAGWMFHADSGYDSDLNCKAIFNMGMHPNIKQRKSRKNSGNRRNVGKPFRRRAAEMFDPARFQRRKMIEGIFGAEESSNHRLYCRHRKKETQKMFGLLLAITWNACALNRIRCASETAVASATA